MHNLLKWKNILITWASWDIGLATAKMCYDNWANLYLFSFRNEYRLKDFFKLYDKNRINIYSCDATDELEVEKIFNKLKSQKIKLNGLFNNIWDLIRREYFLNSNWKLFNDSFNLTMKSAYLFTKFSYELLEIEASIVMMSSMTARWWKWDRSSHYWMSKAAIVWLWKCLADELWKINKIRVNIISPWYITWSFHNKYTKKEVEIEHSMNNPLWRVGTPEDVASVVVFLLSDLSSYVNWANIDINGWSFIW